MFYISLDPKLNTDNFSCTKINNPFGTKKLSSKLTKLRQPYTNPY